MQKSYSLLNLISFNIMSAVNFSVFCEGRKTNGFIDKKVND